VQPVGDESGVGSDVLAAEEGKGWRSDRGAGVSGRGVKCMDKNNDLMGKYHELRGCGVSVLCLELGEKSTVRAFVSC
jgi:hypothetical protein